MFETTSVLCNFEIECRSHALLLNVVSILRKAIQTFQQEQECQRAELSTSHITWFLPKMQGLLCSFCCDKGKICHICVPADPSKTQAQLEGFSLGRDTSGQAQWSGSLQ